MSINFTYFQDVFTRSGLWRAEGQYHCIALTVVDAADGGFNVQKWREDALVGMTPRDAQRNLSPVKAG